MRAEMKCRKEKVCYEINAYDITIMIKQNPPYTSYCGGFFSWNHLFLIIIYNVKWRHWLITSYFGLNKLAYFQSSIDKLQVKQNIKISTWG